MYNWNIRTRVYDDAPHNIQTIVSDYLTRYQATLFTAVGIFANDFRLELPNKLGKNYKLYDLQAVLAC